MIDAKAFGAELAGIVKAATAPLLARIDALEKALADRPEPQAGRDGRDGADGKDGEPGAPGEKGADGIGLAGAFIDRDGKLVVTLTNGETKALGAVVGKDGAAGVNGKDGAPGQDGLGFDDMDFEERDGRLYAVFRRGDVAKAARLPGISYRGVWKAGDYLTGDSVTFGACQWIATQDTDEKPGEGKAWQLAVRKGRDGKDGIVKAAEDKAPLKVGGRNAG